jgi:hypothetical protein
VFTSETDTAYFFNSRRSPTPWMNHRFRIYYHLFITISIDIAQHSTFFYIAID